MSVSYPLHIIRKTDKQWLRRTAQAVLSALPHDPVSAPDCCPECAVRAPVAPWRSDYVPGGMIEHHWACNGCGQTWITRIDVSASSLRTSTLRPSIAPSIDTALR